jgi:hypothetical protein
MSVQSDSKSIYFDISAEVSIDITVATIDVSIAVLINPLEYSTT